jgi:hypothetical protein
MPTKSWMNFTLHVLLESSYADSTLKFILGVYQNRNKSFIERIILMIRPARLHMNIGNCGWVSYACRVVFFCVGFLPEFFCFN